VREQQHRRLRVAEVIVETDDARSFVVDIPAEHAERYRYRAGQFITVRVPREDGMIARCYSLSSSPDDRLTFTVKRIQDGMGSNWLCDNVAAGTELDILPPAGTFTPKSLDGQFLFFAAGSGITPVMSILRTVLAQGRGDAVLVYANRDEDSVIFGAELDRLAKAHPDRLTVIHWLETDGGLPHAAGLRDVAAPYAEREAFVCGPDAFMAEVHKALKELGVPRSRVHVERFLSLPEDPFIVPDVIDRALAEARAAAEAETGADDGGAGSEADGVVEVELDGDLKRIPWPAGTKLLDLLVDNGLSAPFSCRQGLCGACTTRITEGEVSMLENEVLEPEDLEDGYILACQSLRESPVVRITYD
jgi:3-ketosteroid 9alpha-monooxygenase subunit B